MSEVRIPDTNFPGRRSGSYLVDETFLMEQQRRLDEQNGQRQFARVNAIEHAEQRLSAGDELQNESGIKQHPDLNRPKYDGDEDNPIPAMNTEAKKKYDEAKEEQKLDLQKRLNLSMQYSSAPKPSLF